jgi:hypothetical protein
MRCVGIAVTSHEVHLKAKFSARDGAGRKTRMLQPPERPRFFTRDRGADRPLIDCTASPRLTAPASAARTPKGGIFRASRAPSRQRPDPAGPVKGHSRRVKMPSPMTSARQNFKSGHQTVLKSGAASLRGLSADIYRSCGKRVAVDPLDGRCLECLCARPQHAIAGIITSQAQHRLSRRSHAEKRDAPLRNAPRPSLGRDLGRSAQEIRLADRPDPRPSKIK